MNNFWLAAPFGLLLSGQWLSLYAGKLRRQSRVFVGLKRALDEHTDALKSVLDDDRVPKSAKDKLIRISNAACEGKTAKDFLEMTRDVANTTYPKSPSREPVYYDGNNELFSRHVRVLTTAITVSSWISTKSGDDGEQIISRFLSEPDKDEQIVYRFGRDSRRPFGGSIVY